MLIDQTYVQDGVQSLAFVNTVKNAGLNKGG